VSPRTRVFLIVGAVATGAALATVGGTVLLSRGQGTTAEASAGLRSGRPPLALDLGVRTDPEAAALRRATALYAKGKLRDAHALFLRYDSLQAQVGAAVAGWPEGTLAALDRLAREHPGSGVVRLHLGLALLWSRRDADALAQWRRALRVDPDSPAALEAENLLYPKLFRGRPVFVPDFAAPPQLARLSPPQALAFLARGARARDARARLLYGVALQRLGRFVSAEREFRAAAAIAPRDPDTRVAAAVGLFAKADPSRAFSRLGPLVRVFPHAATVRFHLGLLLLWLGEGDRAKQELRLARTDSPRSIVGREANSFLVRLAGVGTS
jgi:tetratricopeptide (TPR) repeat protein